MIREGYGITSKRNYDAVHQWLRRKYGVASKCKNPLCDKSSRKFQWALKVGKKYLQDKDSFQELCTRCHSEYDSKHNLRTGLVAPTKHPRKYGLVPTTPYERVKKWRQKSKKNAEYKNKHRRKKRRELRKSLAEGKIEYSQIPKSYNITPLKSEI